MTLRERIADWISGGTVTFWYRLYADAETEAAKLRAEAANIAAWRDEAMAEAQHWKSCDRISKQYLTAKADALRAILTARNITEARRIAKQALGGE